MLIALYLTDTFDKLNDLNLSFQGKNTNMLVLNTKLQAFHPKLSSWLNSFNRKRYIDMFTSLHDFLTTNKLLLTNSVSNVILDHKYEMQQFFFKK